MKLIAIAAAVLSLAGCETMRTVAPHTVSGFEAGGVLGALDGASGAILARCQTLDGQILRVAIDDLAAGSGTAPLVDDIRVRRHQACALIGAVQVIADEAGAPRAGLVAPGQEAAGVPQG